MTEEERKGPQIVSREDLYRQVWETPASRLCAQYGISGRGLKNICDRLNVPSPPRGYWARLAAGQRIKQASDRRREGRADFLQSGMAAGPDRDR